MARVHFLLVQERKLRGSKSLGTGDLPAGSVRGRAPSGDSVGREAGWQQAARGLAGSLGPW